MIVQCNNCLTKFKVADEKISEGGTWVRCSRCEQTFEVVRASDRPQPPASEQPSSKRSLEDELFGDLPDGDFGADAEYGAYSPPAAPPAEPDHTLFEMPAPPPAPQAGEERELLPPEEALLPPAPSRSPLLAASPRAALKQPPPKAASRLRRVLTGLAVNLLIAAGLLLVLGAVGATYANDGKLDLSALSPRRIGSALAARSDAVAVESWNGIYDTKSGKPVFYLQGDVQNTSRAAAKLRVRAEILDGNQLVRAAEGLAGAPAGPEDLYNIGSSEDADALAARLEGGSTPVPPGGRARFLLAFYEYPPNLSAFRLKVTVRAVPSTETASP